MKKRKFFNNLIGIPIIAISMLFAFATKTEASIADFVGAMQNGNNQMSVEQSNANNAGMGAATIRSTNVVKVNKDPDEYEVFHSVNFYIPAGYTFNYVKCNMCGAVLYSMYGSHRHSYRGACSLTVIYTTSSVNESNNQTGGGTGPYTPPPPPADTTPPTCSITANPSSMTNAGQITFNISFSESVNGFEQGDLTFSGGTANVASFTGSGSSYSVTVNTEDNKEYTLKLKVEQGKCTDAAGNGNTASNEVEVPIDRIKPEVKFLGQTERVNISNYIKQLYQGVLGREATGNDVNSHLFVYTSTRDLTEVTKNIVASSEAKAKYANKNTDYVKAMYKGILNVDNPDTNGLNAWKGKLDSGTSIEDVVKEFCGSTQVQNMFAGLKNGYLGETYVTKDTDVIVMFTITDTNYSKTTLTENEILVKVGGKQISPTKKQLAGPATIDKGIAYILVLGGLTGDGKLTVTVPAGKIEDRAGNTNVATSTATDGSNADLHIVVDNTKPEVKRAVISNSKNQYGYAKNGDTVTLTIEFSEAISNKPTIKIGGRNVSKIKIAGTHCIAEYTIPSNETSLKEGALSIEISNYKDLAGLKGDTVSKTTDGSKVIYDRTPPKINSISPNGNTTWQKSQSTVINASDNFTANKDIKGNYDWVLDGETIVTFKNAFVNQAKITKNTDTGKYRLYAIVRDLAGNETKVLTNPFYIDNSFTNPGTLKITKNTATGEQYKTHSKTEESGTYYEGGYTAENLYIHKIDGTDDESGHKKTVYVVTKLENGKEIAVGEQSIEDTIIENDGDYKITVTSYDNLNNTGTRVYIIHKGSVNVTFSPYSNSSYEKSVSTKVTLVDTTGLANKMYVEWVKKGEEPKSFSKEIQSGATVSLNSGIGEYILYVKTVDKDGNENITHSGIFKLSAGITNVGSMMFKYNDEQGEDYTPGTFTKENIYTKIKDHGSDAHGGKVTSTYKITKKTENGSMISIGEYSNEAAVLVNEGEYTVTLTSKSELGSQGTQTYKVKIDKTSPEITFNGVDNYNQTGQIQVSVQDKGLCPSGVNTNSLKYYWTRSTKTPTKTDFEGNTENGYRGTLSSASSVVKTPKDVSGIWYLWICAEDNVGNVSIKSNVKIDGGNISYIDNEAPIAGTLKLTEIIEGTEGTKTYTENTYTKNSVKIELLNGYDADSGVKSNTYSIMKDGRNYKTNLTQETVLTEQGIYTAVVITTDNQNNQATRSYTIKIDKEGPEVRVTATNSSDYSKKKEVQVSISDGESGVDTTKTVFKWMGYNPEQYESIEKVVAKIKELQESAGENYVAELAKIGIVIKDQQVDTGEISTPENVTGIYHLYIIAEDKVGNKTIQISDGLKLDNTKPTKPEVKAYEKENLKPYHGALTNKQIQIEAKDSKSLSGVDKYMYSISNDDGVTWSSWQQANYDGKVATVVISKEGNNIVKVKAIAELLDGILESEESNQVTVRIDTKGPECTFANYKTGENGTTQYVKDILVRVTLTEQNSNTVNPNTIKYEWVSFRDINEYNQFAQKTKTLQELKNKMTNAAKSFANGEELPSPANAKGIYSLFVYAEDMTGNVSVNYSNAYRLGTGSTTGNGDSEEESGIILGDLNGDKLVDIVDLSKLQQHIIGSQLLGDKYLKAADLNQDGEIDLIDLSRLMSEIVGITK